MKTRPGARGLGVARTFRGLWFWTPLAGLAVLAVLMLVLEGPTPLRRQACWAFLWNYGEVLDVPEDFEGFDNVTGAFSSAAASPVLVVPNVVHFLRMGQPEFTFLEYVCVLAAWKHQEPDWLMFHTDLPDFRGEYWMRLQATPGLREVIQLVPTQRVTHVFGQPLDPVYGKWHAGDVLRIGILQKYGGIFLDNDAYLLGSLDKLRRYEMSLGWPEGAFLGTQVLLAHPDARFLRVWMESYRAAYVGNLWYYNAGQRPTQMALYARPELVHRVRVRLGVDMDVMNVLYLRRDLKAWRKSMMAVHLFERHTAGLFFEGWKRGLSYPVVFTEDNICGYNVTILQMAQDVLPRLCREQKCLSWLSRKISPDQAFFLFLLSLLLLWYINLYVKFLTLFPRFIPCESKILANVPDRFDGFNNSAAALLSDGEPLVPNVIHFVRVGEGSEIVAVEEAACISAALRALPGSTAIIHTDRPELRGVGWERLLGREGGRIRVQRRPRSLHVFGLPYRDLGTMHRVAALRVLIKHGGVYVPNKTYLTDATATVYRQLECATASAASSDLGVVLAHRDARQLQQWLRLHHDADLVWAERPPHEPHLCRAIEEVLSLEAKENLAELVHGGDEYLLAPVLPAVAAVDDEA